MRHSIRLLTLLLCWTSGTTADAVLQKSRKGGEDDDYKLAKARYDECLARPPFLMHARGQDHLATTRDPRALEVLARSYAKPRGPQAHSQYLITDIATHHCRDPEHLPIYTSWRKRHRKPADAWLWFRSLRIDASHQDTVTALTDIVKGKDNLWLRAAALEALAWSKDPEILDLVPHVLDNLPSKAGERAVLLESLMHGLASQRWSLGDRTFAEPAEQLVRMMDDKKTLDRTRLSFARMLGRLFKTELMTLETEPWLRLIDIGQVQAPKVVDDKYGKPRFFELKATGSRICYVMDMSDSMCKLVPEKYRRRGSVTGLPREKPKKLGPKDVPGPNDIPWHRVKTRFDLAREHVKLSLLRLPPSAHFSVVWFGDGADLLESCRGMTEASRTNVNRVIRELDAIQLAPPIPTRPDGVLRGKTNLHGGLRRAFKVQKKGLAGDHEYVDLKPLEQGCDTIFVLSDGDPTWDDWPTRAPNYGEDTIGDPESRIKGGEGNIMHYSGPYRAWRHLLTDVERLNLFRKAEILCVGIGKDVQAHQLKKLAEIGHGTIHITGD